MQINNTVSTYYPVVAVEQRNNNQNRLPVVYQDLQQLKPVISEQRADNTSVVLPAEKNDQQQQARFVREFSSVEREITGPPQNPAAQLSRSVLQYQAMASLNLQDNQRGSLIDETV